MHMLNVLIEVYFFLLQYLNKMPNIAMFFYRYDEQIYCAILNKEISSIVNEIKYEVLPSELLLVRTLSSHTFHRSIGTFIDPIIFKVYEEIIK